MRVASNSPDLPNAATDAPPLAPGLYVVATPIGNLEDITLRALRVLRGADRIACEDTRQTGKLLAHFGITTQTVSYHLHNERERADELVAQLRTGMRIAVVSDAGTPGIADPGETLVRAAIQAGIVVYPIPGANAAVTCLSASGFRAETFVFCGFLPSKAGERRTALEQAHREMAAGAVAATRVFYETPHRILDALSDVAAVFGPAYRVVLARELTKLHEEFLRGTVAEVQASLQARGSVRGEMVLLLSGDLPPGTGEQAAPTLAKAVRALLASGIEEKDALKQVARERGLGKSDAYREWQRTRGKG